MPLSSEFFRGQWHRGSTKFTYSIVQQCRREGFFYLVFQIDAIGLLKDQCFAHLFSLYVMLMHSRQTGSKCNCRRQFQIKKPHIHANVYLLTERIINGTKVECAFLWGQFCLILLIKVVVCSCCCCCVIELDQIQSNHIYCHLWAVSIINIRGILTSTYSPLPSQDQFETT